MNASDDLNKQEQTGQNHKNRTETGQQKKGAIGRLPKTHLDYWAGRITHRTYHDADGRKRQIPTWQARMFSGRNEGWFNLGTAEKTQAAIKAREIYTFLRANGWDETVTRYKPQSDSTPRVNLTVGDYLKAAEKTGRLEPRTFLNYQNALRTIVSETFGVKDTKAKFDHKRGGNKTWKERIDRIRLERVTPNRVNRWKRNRLVNAGKSPTARASAKRTINSYIRCARSLFSPAIREDDEFRGVKLPAVLPFQGVCLEEGGSTKYNGEVRPEALIAAAKLELKVQDPEVYKVFLLAMFAGLRKAEIDLAEWSMIDWDNGILHIHETKFLHLKTEESAAAIPIEAEPLAELRGFLATGGSPFIIQSVVTRKYGKNEKTTERKPRESVRAYYRCKPVFDRLVHWLVGKGITGNKPIHTLRKAIGAEIATRHGLYAASVFLRHTDTATTEKHYANYHGKFATGLGAALDPAPKVVRAKRNSAR